jgi:hypothetical protein
LQYETICDHICDDIATVLLGMQPATPTAAYAAACATRDVAAAFHHAAGDPVNPRWRDAIGSLERFLAYSTRSPGVKNLAPLRELATFVHENADLLAPQRESTARQTSSRGIIDSANRAVAPVLVPA